MAALAGRVDNTTGYSGVALLTAHTRRTPFGAKSPRGKQLGSFATAEEAALALARAPGACTAAAAA